MRETTVDAVRLACLYMACMLVVVMLHLTARVLAVWDTLTRLVPDRARRADAVADPLSPSGS